MHNSISEKKVKSINLMFLIIEIWWNHSNEIQNIFGKQNLVKKNY